MSKITHSLTAVLLLSMLVCSSHSQAKSAPSVTGIYDSIQVKLLGEAIIQTGERYGNTVIGGLSGISYTPATGLFHCVSDDRSLYGPARLYTMVVDLSDHRLGNGDITFVGIESLKNENGRVYSANSINPEGICKLSDQSFFICSEGDLRYDFSPFLAAYSKEGYFLWQFPLPEKFYPSKQANKGIRDNASFESLALTPDGKYLFAAIENALKQDGPAPALAHGSPARILKYHTQNGIPPEEYLYNIESLDSNLAEFHFNAKKGLVELIALNENQLLSLERTYYPGHGASVQLFHVSLSDADNISSIQALSDVDVSQVKTSEKRLIGSLENLGIKPDNIEAMTIGPELGDDTYALVMVSDNNFSAVQKTQFLAFSITLPGYRHIVNIHDVQGDNHFSPRTGEQVRGIKGVITALKKTGNSKGFWMQSVLPDKDDATSEGIYVSTGKDMPAFEIGMTVLVDGKIAERQYNQDLPLTQIKQTDIAGLTIAPLPEPVVIGVDGRMPPNEIIDNDSLQIFQPAEDGIDFYESLEGMRVLVNDAIVVGGSNRYGEFIVLANGGNNTGERTTRGGIYIRPHDFNPERILVSTSLTGELPSVHVSDRFDGPITGVLDYNYGNFKIMLTDSLPGIKRGQLEKEETDLLTDSRYLTVASYNVENLSAVSTDSKFKQVGLSIVNRLHSPDIIAIQEIQDNDGPDNSGIVNAEKTYERLIRTVAELGGPEYEFCQIDPANNEDGGQPGGNIRAGILFKAARIDFTNKSSTNQNRTQIQGRDSETRLSPNPGWLAPQDAAFHQSRKPLAAEFKFNGQTYYIIVNHLSSKGDDDALFGLNQPPHRVTEQPRTLQAQILQTFVTQILNRHQSANIIVLGDLNDFEFSKPIQELKGQNLHNLIELIPENDRYTYNYQGNSQVLDHILISKNLMQTTKPEIDIVHFNCDFSHDQRASDHDAVIARFNMVESE